jgi:hypothetical protein
MEDEIISRLKFIGTVKKNEKISVKNLKIQKDDLFTQITRTFVGHESRERTLNFITTTLNISYNLFNNEINSRVKGLILQDLEHAKAGILNIRQTYMVDSMFICRLDSVIQQLNIFLEINGISIKNMAMEHEKLL